jgi:hypothetical protein
MDNIVGIRFREGGKIYHFIPGHFVLKELSQLRSENVTPTIPETN